MTIRRPLNALGLGVVVATVAGCAAYHEYRECGAKGCASDARITNEVRAQLDQRQDLRADVHVQTWDGVVYLTGQVTTDMQRDAAERMAQNVRGVQRIIDTVTATADSGR